MTKHTIDPYLRAEADTPLALASMHARPKITHIFAQEDIDAVNAAIATNRPLLLRGEPGIGKSQLARAVAQCTGRAFVSRVVDARTEPGDLAFRYDAVRRLAMAQLQSSEKYADLNALEEEKFIAPGPLWWAFDWGRALTQAKVTKTAVPWSPTEFEPKKHGVVVLIDEIDKADSSVPNGLLEALGAGRFSVTGYPEDIERTGPAPLIVITTNEERTLPGAFLRRCWVREIKPGDDFVAWLMARGRAHYPKTAQVSDVVLKRAAEQLAQDREALKARHLAPPGQAEYLDLLGALIKLAAQERKKGQRTKAVQLELLDRIGQFVFKKHPSPRGSA